jgi:hypothetical protein
VTELKVGDRVVFVKAPDWLLKDLPKDEQDEICSFVGRITEITEVDKFGYFWIGFGSQTENGDQADYAGHSFAVTSDCLRIAG